MNVSFMYCVLHYIIILYHIYSSEGFVLFKISTASCPLQKYVLNYMYMYLLSQECI
jgi:hypothetical protein